MTEQEKTDQFNRDVDDVLKGNAPQAGTDPQRLDAARQLAAADFSTRSRARLTTRARLLARAKRELPVQNKRKEMNTRFSNVFRTLAFGAFLLLIVFGLGWVLSNTTPQVGLGLETPGAEVTEIDSPVVPVGAGDVYLVLDGNNASNPNFVYFPADCLVENMTCPTPEAVANVPQGSLNTLFEWSPDFSKVISIFTYSQAQVWMFDRNGQTWAQMNTPLFISTPIWSPDGKWLIGMFYDKINSPSTALLLARADGSEWQEILTDFPGFYTPIGWTDATHWLFFQTYQDTNSVVHYDLRQYEIGTGAVSTIRELAPVNVLSRENSRLSGIDLSPDKSQIVYTFVSIGDEPKETELAILNLGTGEQSTVTVDDTWTDITWSPDGKKFAMTTGIDPALTCQVQIGDIGSRYLFTGSWAGNCDATWSPDGRYVLVPALAQENKTVLYLIDASDNATRQIEIPGVGVQDVLPHVSWIPDVGSSPTLNPPELVPRIFRSEANHLEVTVPDGWAAYEGQEYIANPFTGVVAFNSWGEQGFWVKETIVQESQDVTSYTYSSASVLAQIPQDGAYIVLVWQSGGPAISEPGTLNAEYPGSDLSGLWQAGDCRENGGQSFGFNKFERMLSIQIYCGSQISDATANDVNSLLASWRFDTPQLPGYPPPVPGYPPPVPTAEPPAPLTLESDSETIRQRILLSHTFWQALWADAQITDYVSGTPAVQRVQVWVNQPAQARVLSGKADGTPATLWISDGQMTRTGEDLSGYGLENFIPPMTESDTVYPHPMTGIMPTPLSSLLFPSGLAQRGGTYRPIAIETVAGRETLVVEWNRPDGPLTDRFWVDTVTGVILHQQNYGKGGDGALTYEYLISNIQFDLTFHPETFNRLAAFPPAFAVAAEDIFTEVVTPMPEGEADTSLASGEIYLDLEKSSMTEPLGFWRFPASCLVSGNPCPSLESVPGTPLEFAPQVSWSPDGSRMIYTLMSSELQNWLFTRLSQSWKLIDTPFFGNPVWSPDGEWVVGVPAGRPENYSLVLTRADGTERQTLMDGTSEIKTPIAWLDDHRILMTTTLDNETSEESPTLAEDLQIYDLQTGEIQTLLSKVWNPDTTFYGAFALSPDRTKVVYAIAERNGQYSEIRILTIADNTEFSFTFPSPVGPSWSPNGEWLSLTSGDGYSCQIHLIRPDGSEPHPVFTGDWGGGCQHIWSPDGQYLLVPALAQTPTIPRLYVINVATGESRLVELPDVGVEFEWPVVSWVP
ncbi:MAG: PD40 domain-containing protein [Anaerolineales bacterium]|nr:PD40 domain-containing protein [Anaerolineales bacterium]